MTYSFIDISASKFSLNSRELFKTFIAIPVKTNNIKIVNIYDSSSVLIPTTLVSEIEVDGVTYNNSTDLVNAIHDVLFSSSTSGSLDSQQIELNRLAIIDLQNNQTNSNHNHDSRYYSKNEVDAFISNVVSSSDLITKGEIDGDTINFRKSNNTVVFSIDAKLFTSQGTIVSFENGVLTLKNSKGEVLSTTNVKAKESYYDKFKYISGIEDDLSDLILTDPFQLVKTNGDLYFLVSDTSNLENFLNSKIYFNLIDSFFDLSAATISNNNFNAWQLLINSNEFVESEMYYFNAWFGFINFTSSDNTIKIEGNSLRNNVSDYIQEKIWNTGDSSTLTFYFNPTNLLHVFVKTGGTTERLDTSQFTVQLPSTINITKTLSDGDVITLHYQYFTDTQNNLL